MPVGLEAPSLLYVDHGQSREKGKHGGLPPFCCHQDPRRHSVSVSADAKASAGPC